MSSLFSIDLLGSSSVASQKSSATGKTKSGDADAFSSLLKQLSASQSQPTTDQMTAAATNSGYQSRVGLSAVSLLAQETGDGTTSGLDLAAGQLGGGSSGTSFDLASTDGGSAGSGDIGGNANGSSGGSSSADGRWLASLYGNMNVAAD